MKIQVKEYQVQYQVKKWFYRGGIVERKENSEHFMRTTTYEPNEILADLYERHRAPELVGLIILDITEQYEEFPVTLFDHSLN